MQEAEVEADAVLARYPDDQDALLVKANVLRWRGNAAASLPYYEKALAQGENFEARIGLAYAYLDSGEKDTAKEISTPLKPLYPYQEKELARLTNVEIVLLQLVDEKSPERIRPHFADENGLRA